MPLPRLLSGPHRQFVQAVWDLAFASLRWPTFAELDRRLDHAYDIQALDVLREIPPGFLYGVGTDSPPTDDQAIGLTVAGAASCAGTDELLVAFVEFIQMAARVERGWQPLPGEPDAQPCLSGAEFAEHARVLPAAGRDDLLLLLFRLLQVERDGWGATMIDPESRQWRISLTREIRPFRGVTDLDDYWSRRHKPWETRMTNVLPPTRDDARSRSDFLAADIGLVADVLLELLYDKAQPHCQPGIRDSLFAPIRLPAVEGVADPTAIQAAVAVLQSKQFVAVVSTATGTEKSGRPEVVLTEAGAARVVSTRAVMTNSLRRGQFARNRLLAWLHEQRKDPRGAVLVDNVLRGRHGAVGGQFFTIEDVDDAASYLREKGLIAGSGVNERRGPVLAYITADGIDCIERGGNVAEYLRQPNKPDVAYNFHAPVSGANFAVGDHNAQYAAATGIDATGLRSVMVAITETIASLRMPPEDEHALTAATAEVTAEIALPAPDRSRISIAAKKILTLLAKAGSQAVATAYKMALEAELTRLGLPPAQ